MPWCSEAEQSLSGGLHIRPGRHLLTVPAGESRFLNPGAVKVKTPLRPVFKEGQELRRLENQP